MRVMVAQIAGFCFRILGDFRIQYVDLRGYKDEVNLFPLIHRISSEVVEGIIRAAFLIGHLIRIF